MSMPSPYITHVDHLDGDTVLIDLSDNTTITLTLEELLTLRPQRVPAPPEPSEEDAG